MRQVRILDSLQMIFQAVYEKTESVLATVEINKARRFELSSIQPLQIGDAECKDPYADCRKIRCSQGTCI